ncbi:putative hydrolase of the HAD superfamily [Salibacterium salarium]|uniref:HAD family hydrolase n=1 Tax=Salibacterium salarium TaxID=284579 RepID=UPI0027866423|nr:HAD family hydrolase [Salibacterium salarium]MDQ0298138.1 putative hydrolase of the HAD superfamily [Salibacterium salarium]
MTIPWNKIDAAIFDLDGTLYEDTHHFDYYAKQLEEKLPEHKRSSFRKDYNKMMRGEHPVVIGRIYDTTRDRILEVHPETYQVMKTWNWEGDVVSEGEDYKVPVKFDFDTMIAIGDGWWPPVAAAKHYGVGSTFDAYKATKLYMQTEAFQFAKHPERRESLLRLQQYMTLVLLTNSQADDVEQLLTTLDLQGVFHDVIPNAKKPAQTGNQFTTVMKKYNLSPDQVVSIGDNYLNDIIPAENLGMYSVLIDPQGRTQTRSNTVRIRSLSDLFPLINL